MADNKVLIELQLIQKGDQVSLVQKQTEKLSKSTDKAARSTKNLNKAQDTQYTRQKQGVIGTANTTKNFSKMQQTVDGGNGAGGLVRAYALLAANVFALTAAFGILSRSAQIETLTKSIVQLEIVSGKSIRGVARNLQEASGYGMDFAESMRAVSLATSAGFGGAQIEALGKVAKNAAVSLGRNIPDALDRIFRGVIKVEPELLDEIGLFVRVNEASAKYAATLGKAVGDLTEFEKRQAFLTEALEQGTTKFAAFEDIQIDAFAELQTVFSDMAQSILGHILPALEGLISFLARNQVLFGTVFGALVFTLLKMAIPAMGLFTQSMAANAVQARTTAEQQSKRAKFMALQAQQDHAQQIKFTQEQLAEKAKLAAAETRGGPQNQLSVRGRAASKRLEVALQKEGISLAGRRQVIEQRIADINKKQGKDKRLAKVEVQKELKLLQAELAIHKQIAAEEAKLLGLKQAGNLGQTSEVVVRAARIKAIKAEGLARVTATAETYGFSRAISTARFQLQLMDKQIKLAGGSFGFLQKAMFMTKATATSLGVAAQGMWMKLLGPFSIFLMLLPVFQGFLNLMGVGGESAQKLAKGSKALDEALTLMPKRLQHVNEQFEEFSAGGKERNLAFEAFNAGLGTTAKALIDQMKAFEEYKNDPSVGWFANFWEETIPKLWGGDTASQIEKGREAILKGFLDETDVTKVSKNMQELITKYKASAEEIEMYDPATNTTFTVTRYDEGIGTEIVEQSAADNKALTTLRSSIDGAKDSARGFAKSLIITTAIDKPLSSFRQMDKNLDIAKNSWEDISSYVTEIANDQAILSMLMEDERIDLQDTTKTTEQRLKVITDVKNRMFEQQEFLIRQKVLTAEINAIQKSLAKATKDSADAVELTIQKEEGIRKLKAKQVKFNFQNKVSATGLTQAKIAELASEESLLPLLEDKSLKEEDIAKVQSAIVAYKEQQIVLTQNAIDKATAEFRKAKMLAEVELKSLKTQEKANKLIRDAEKMKGSILRGGGNENAFEKTKTLIADEVAAIKTREKIATQEANIVKADMNAKAAEMEVLATREGVSETDAAMYTQAAEDLRQAGKDIADNIEEGAKNAALKFIETLTKGASKGSSFAEATFSDINARQSDSAIFKTIENTQEGTGKDQMTPEEKRAAKAKVAINSIESSLLKFAKSMTDMFGEEGALVAAFATVGANLLDLGQNFGETFNKAEGGMAKAAVVAGAAASAIGQIGQLTAAQAKQDIAAIDSLIEAEKSRDGKSKESLAKIAGMEKKKEAMKRKAFEDNKKMMLAQAVMSTAQGIASALAGPPGLPWSAVFAGMMAAMGMKQISIIKGMTYKGGAAAGAQAPQSISIGKRNNMVDVAKGATAGELAYLRGEKGIGSNANNFTPGGAAGMKRGYSNGGEILVGERGPETIRPTNTGYAVTPNDKMGGSNLNANITINAVDAAGVEEVLTAQTGTIINMLQQAAHEHGEEFIEAVNPASYGGGTGG